MELQERLDEVRSHIAAAERQAGRAAGSVQLVAVSKTFDAEQIRPAISAGQRVFGENRVQESQGKWPELKTQTPGIELHLIGPLQSNKAADAVALFDVIETIDREKIARAIADAALPYRIAIDRNTHRLIHRRAAGAQPQEHVKVDAVVV